MKNEILENYERAFTAPMSGCQERCECGQVFYNPSGGWDWEEGELEGLEADKNATAVDYSVQRVFVNGKLYASDCDCWHPVALKIADWLDANDTSIAEFFKLEKERKEKLAREAVTVEVLYDEYRDGWRDIAEAPRDATWLEVLMRDRTTRYAHWAQDLSGEEQPPFRGWFERSGDGFGHIEDPIAWRGADRIQRATPTNAEQGEVAIAAAQPNNPQDREAACQQILLETEWIERLGTNEMDRLMKAYDAGYNARGQAEGPGLREAVANLATAFGASSGEIPEGWRNLFEGKAVSEMNDTELRAMLDTFGSVTAKYDPVRGKNIVSIDPSARSALASSGKQTHTKVVRYTGDTPGDCMLCGAEIRTGELCERTELDGDISYCCRKCTEGDCPEEYAVLANSDGGEGWVEIRSVERENFLLRRSLELTAFHYIRACTYLCADGAEKAQGHRFISEKIVEFITCRPYSSAWYAASVLVHDDLQAVTDHLDEAIGLPLETPITGDEWDPYVEKFLTAVIDRVPALASLVIERFDNEGVERPAPFAPVPVTTEGETKI